MYNDHFNQLQEYILFNSIAAVMYATFVVSEEQGTSFAGLFSVTLSLMIDVTYALRLREGLGTMLLSVVTPIVRLDAA